MKYLFNQAAVVQNPRNVFESKDFLIPDIFPFYPCEPAESADISLVQDGPGDNVVVSHASFTS